MALDPALEMEFGDMNIQAYRHAVRTATWKNTRQWEIQRLGDKWSWTSVFMSSLSPFLLLNIR